MELISSEVRKWMQLINIGFFFLCGILLLTIEHSSLLIVVQDGEFLQIAPIFNHISTKRKRMTDSYFFLKTIFPVRCSYISRSETLTHVYK